MKRISYFLLMFISPRTGFIIPFVLLLITSSIGLFTYNRVKNKRFILKI